MTIEKRNPSKSMAICGRLLRICFPVRRSNLLNNNFNPDTGLVRFMIPDYLFLREVCSMSLGPLALTSANYSTLHVEKFAPLQIAYNTVFDSTGLAPP